MANAEHGPAHAAPAVHAEGVVHYPQAPEPKRQKGWLERWSERVRNVALVAAAITGVLNPLTVLRWTYHNAGLLLAYLMNPANIPLDLGIAAGAEVTRRIGKAMSSGKGHGGGH